MEEFHDEGIAWPSFVDFLSIFVFLLFLFIGSLLYLQTGDVELATFLTNSQELRGRLNGAGIENYTRGRMQIIPLKNRLKFGSGQHELTPGHKAFLRQLGSILSSAAACRRIIVAGYADGVPVSNDPFGNWKLSSARAQNVLEFFFNCRDCGYGEEIRRRLVLSGEGDTGSKNLRSDPGARRVDIIVDYTDDAGR